MPLPLILDTDIGNDPDDLLALSMILDREDLFDLKAVVTTGKNPELRACFVHHLCQLSSRNIPIGAGQPTECSKEPSEFHIRFFKDKGANLSNKNFPKAREVISSVLSPQITLMTIGPLTTIADFFAHNPSGTIDKLTRLVSMGGFISRKKTKYVKEYNFGSDKKATDTVLEKGIDHLCVTKNVCSKVLMHPYDLAEVMFTKSPARQFAFSFMQKWLSQRQKKKLHDPFTAAVALTADKIPLARVAFEIDEKGCCMGQIIDNGPILAAIGGTPKNIDWFFDIFYKEVS